MKHSGWTEPSRRTAPVLLLLLWLGACVAPPAPGADPDLLAAMGQAAPERTPDLMRQQQERLARQPFLAGNRVELLVDGPASFAALAAAIEGATLRIDMETYEFDEEAGSAFGDLLLAARRRGVEVNLIYDSWGTVGTPATLLDRLHQGGVRLLEYNPLRPNARVPIDVNRRDHRKLLCVDGRIAITGGVNITRVYRNRPAGPDADPDEQAWRDTDVRIEGPVVAQFERYFMETWRDQRGAPLAPPPQPPATGPGNTLVMAIDGAPENGQPLIYRSLLAAIALARHSVHLTTGYFVPTPDVVRALVAAVRRGVDVQVMVPARSDSGAAVAAGRGDYAALLEAGVGIHEREGRILHAKTAVIDGAWSAVGSSNLDWRSVVWNNEIDAIILDRAFGRQMEALFAADVARSRRIDPMAWSNRPISDRLGEWTAQLLRQLL